MEFSTLTHVILQGGSGMNVISENGIDVVDTVTGREGKVTHSFTNAPVSSYPPPLFAPAQHAYGLYFPIHGYLD